MGFSDFLELAKQVFDGQLNFKAIAPILLALILSFTFTYHKLIIRKSRSFYSFIRQDDEVKQLKKKISDIKVRLYAPLYQLKTEDEAFNQRIKDVIDKISNSERISTPEVEYISKEIESLFETYHEAISEIRRLIQSINDDLDRADQMGLTRKERIDNIVDDIYPDIPMTEASEGIESRSDIKKNV
ncbi:MAG: hypothetical protein F6K00_34840 [Leptolyngbya sp. SIOISBB]|nr:hypothetical protein [Leptolyngbya sp. SIOISBB]